METEAYGVSSGERKKIEALFDEAKRILALTRLRLRGLSGARDEFLLTATCRHGSCAQNLLRTDRKFSVTFKASRKGIAKRKRSKDGQIASAIRPAGGGRVASLELSARHPR